MVDAKISNTLIYMAAFGFLIEKENFQNWTEVEFFFFFIMK